MTKCMGNYCLHVNLKFYNLKNDVGIKKNRNKALLLLLIYLFLQVCTIRDIYC